MEQKKPNTVTETCEHCHGEGRVERFQTMDDLLAHVLSGGHAWRPGWFYNFDGDQIECFWDDCPMIAEWHKEGFTLHRDMNDRSRIVGVTIQFVTHKLAHEYTVRPVSTYNPCNAQPARL
jgi:hypothetical protein